VKLLYRKLHSLESRKRNRKKKRNMVERKGKVRKDMKKNRREKR